MEWQFELQVISKILGDRVDIDKVKDRLMKLNVLEGKVPVKEKQIFFQFSTNENTKKEFKKSMMGQLEIAFQILINQGYKIFVCDSHGEDIEIGKSFVEVFKTEAIQYVRDIEENSGILDLLCESSIQLVLDREDIAYPLFLSKPFIALFDDGELEKRLELENTFINKDEFNAGTLVNIVKYKEENNEKSKEAIKRIFNRYSRDLSEGYSLLEDNINNDDGYPNVKVDYGTNVDGGQNEMEVYKKQFKGNIETLIEQGLLQEAKDLLRQYEEIVEDDIDIYSIKGVIAMMEGDIDKAEEVLKEGLEIELFNVDILCNLGYICEIQGKYISAYRHYKKLKRIASEAMLQEVNIKLKELEKIEGVKEYISRKKVLFIAHIFPPVGGSGVQRSLKFVKYLRDFGWEPVVVTVGNTRYPLKDETMVSEIPEEVEVIRIDERINVDLTYANKLLQIYNGIVNDNILMAEYIKELNKSQEHINQLLLIPDFYILWATEVLDKIDDKVDFRQIDMIYTTSGPYSDHIIGYYLKQKYNRPWVADFRDEWTNNPMANYSKYSIRYKMDFAIENNVVCYADSIITTTKPASQNYIKNFKLDFKKVVTLTNGFDEEDFKGINTYTDSKNEKFTIMHNGLLYGNRTPIPFIKAIKNLITKKRINPNKIITYFTYTDNDEEYIKYVNNIGLSESIRFIGYLNHLESLEKVSQADLLLLIIGGEEKWKNVHAGKVFEYLRLCKPIISLSPQNSITENVLEEFNRGKNFCFSDVKGIENYILELYHDWENNKLKTFEITNDISKFERKTLTKKLSGIFEELLERQEYEEVDSFVENRDIKKTGYLDEMDIYKNKFKKNIKFLLEQGLLKEAKGMIVQYGQIAKDDVEIYSIEGIIAMMEEDVTEAERLFKEGLNIDSHNFDLAYNLAYLYQNTQRKELAIKYYKQAFNSTKNKNDEDEVYKALKELGVEERIEKSVIERKKKIVFFSTGDDKFIWDIINELSKEYETKKITITKNEELKLIDQWMEWADICWFEWCDELIIYGSKLSIASQRKVICRIHGYEVYTDYIKQVNWRNVDQLIIVAPHIRRMFEEYTKDIDKGSMKTDTMFCGINIHKYPINNKIKGFNLGYLGYINFKKNIPLTLDIFKKLHDIDSRYKLHIAGQFQDARTLAYLKYFIKEHKLENSFVFYGWLEQCEKVEWFKNINYMLISSIDEGLCFAAAEAMSSGIKPILHNCEGIKDHYDKKYIFNTIDEAVEMIISGEYNSIEYRRFIEKNYPLSKEIKQVKQIIEDMEKVTEKEAISPLELQFNYKTYWEERYQKGGDSGGGSYGKFAEFKAKIVNKLVDENNIKNVIEFGCGDGNQLEYMQYKNYVGLDISPTAIELCSKKFKGDKNKKFINYVPGKLNSILKKIDMAVCLDVLYHIIDEEDFVKTLDDIFSVSANFVVLYTFLEEPNIRLSIHLKYRNIIEYLKKYKNYSVYQIIKQKYIDESFADFIILKKKVDIINVQSTEYAINIINRFSYFTKELIEGFDFNSSMVSIGKMEKLSEEYLLTEYILSDKTNKKLVLTGIILDILNNNIIYPEYIRESTGIKQIDVITRKILQSEKGNIYNSNIYGFIYDVDIMADIELNELAYNWRKAIPGTQFMPLGGYLNVALRYELARKFINKNDVVLEAGSGFGYGAAYLSRICQQVEALDIVEDNIIFGQEAYGFKNINWMKGDVTNLPYNNNKFDAYITYETLEHIPLKLVDSYLMEATRVLKKEGKFIISTPNKINRKNINNPFHIKEYDFIGFDNILKQYFKDIEYYSIENNTLSRGISNGSKVMIAIAYNS